MSDIDEFYSIGGEEYFSKGICIIEWGELIEPLLNEYIKIEFQKQDLDDNIRTLIINTYGGKYKTFFKE